MRTLRGITTGAYCASAAVKSRVRGASVLLRLGVGGLLVRLGLRLGGFRFVRALVLPLAGVVGDVPAAPFELDRRGRKELAQLSLALRTPLQGLVGDLLDHLEAVTAFGAL